ncbi:MAG: NUDIX domain-containing protein [Patescibacteria group bacterium]
MALEISAGIIIYRKTIDGPRFLILYHGRGYWNFPKGKIESEERTFQTALREIREETGISRNELKFEEPFKAFEKFVFWRKEEKIYKTITFYLAETKRKAIKISEVKEGQPHEGFAWFTYKEAIKVLSKHKDSMRVLKQAYDFLQKKNSAVHRNGNAQNIRVRTAAVHMHQKSRNYGEQNNAQRKNS